MGPTHRDADDPPWLSDEEQRSWRAFVGATHLLFDQLDRELQRDAGIPHAYYEILVRLADSPERTLRMRDLAELTRSSPSRLSHAIARLEASGWIRREQCPSDRRGFLARLTDEGMAVLERAAPGHVRGVRRHLLEPLTDEEFAQLGAISAKVLGHLESLGEAPVCPS